MSWQMEHRFLYERLKKPRSNKDRLLRALIETRNLADASGDFQWGPEVEHGKITLFPFKFFIEAFKKWQVPEEMLTAVYHNGGMQDPSAQCLSHIGSLFLDKGSAQNYVFAKDFWRLLQKSDFTDFRWSNLPKDLCCSIRFPEPILDEDGDPILEMHFAITTKEKILKLRFGQTYPASQDKPGDHVVLGWWQYAHHAEVHGFVHQIYGLDDDRITDTWNKIHVDSPGVLLANTGNLETVPMDYVPKFMFQAIKALVYINTGDPDLREFQNKIRYREVDKKRPIGDHKEYSELPFNVVGFNWKKEREQHTDSWAVEPFMRWQRVGPGRKDLKLTMVKEHTRSWKQKDEQPQVGL